MFKTCHPTYLYGYDSDYNYFRCIIEIVDDDFKETIEVECPFSIGGDAAYMYVVALLKIYSKKNLDILSNLILLVLFIKTHFTFRSIKDILKYLEENIPEFRLYRKEIEKILLFN